MTWIQLEGAVNVRDVGGLSTVDGRSTRKGVLIRSDNLQDLTPNDVTALLDHGVGTVLDLRTAAELEILGPGPLRTTQVVHTHLDMIPQGFDGRAEMLARTLPSEDAGEHAMDHLYFDYVLDAPAQIADALRIVADPGSGAVVVHCAAGKDRTGVVIAIALSLVGVKRSEIIADYVRTDERVAAVRDRLMATELYAESMYVRTLDSMRPRAENMERFLDRVDAEYGGAHGLVMSLGVDEETVARLSRRLIS